MTLKTGEQAVVGVQGESEVDVKQEADRVVPAEPLTEQVCHLLFSTVAMS